jgi:hypothetical protein
MGKRNGWRGEWRNHGPILHGVTWVPFMVARRGQKGKAIALLTGHWQHLDLTSTPWKSSSYPA